MRNIFGAFGHRAVLMVSVLLALSVLHGAAPRSIAPVYSADHENICTAFSVDEAAHLWVTAAHCIEPDLYIDDQLVDVVRVDAGEDLALVHTAIGAVAVPLADVAPVVGDAVRVEGFPLGNGALLVTYGRVSNPAYPFSQIEGRTMAVFDLVVCGGHSGSPILNADGAVVSVVQDAPGQPCGDIAAGPTFANLVAFLRG